MSVCSTGEDATIRDSDPKNSGALKRARGAVLCRAAPSFLRFGSFELPARRGDVELVRKLARYCLRHLGPYLDLSLSKDEVKPNEEGDPKDDYLGLLVAIIEVGPTTLSVQYSSRLKRQQRHDGWSCRFVNEDTLRAAAPSHPVCCVYYELYT